VGEWQPNNRMPCGLLPCRHVFAATGARVLAWREVIYHACYHDARTSRAGSLVLLIQHVVILCADQAVLCCVLLSRCIMLCADHGPCVSGAHNTIVTSRAGKDLVSCLVSGLLTIGPRFGGAIDDAARWVGTSEQAVGCSRHSCRQHGWLSRTGGRAEPGEGTSLS